MARKAFAAGKRKRRLTAAAFSILAVLELLSWLLLTGSWLILATAAVLAGATAVLAAQASGVPVPGAMQARTERRDRRGDSK